MAPAFRKGTQQQVKDGEAEYWVPENTDTNAVIATTNQTTIVNKNQLSTSAQDNVPITHQAVTYLTKDSSGAITGSTRVIYIENDKSL